MNANEFVEWLSKYLKSFESLRMFPNDSVTDKIIVSVIKEILKLVNNTDLQPGKIPKTSPSDTSPYKPIDIVTMYGCPNTGWKPLETPFKPQ